MNTDTTAMGLLIKHIDERCQFLFDKTMRQEYTQGMMDAFKDIRRECLMFKSKEEKEQIEKAYFDGVERELNGDAISPKEYFKQTYSDNN